MRDSSVYSENLRHVSIVGTCDKSCEREVCGAQRHLTGQSSGVGGDARVCVSPEHGCSGDSQVSTAGL